VVLYRLEAGDVNSIRWKNAEAGDPIRHCLSRHVFRTPRRRLGQQVSGLK